MKASAQQQETLLELSQIDLQLRRNKMAVEAIIQGSAIEDIRRELLSVSEELLHSRNLADSLQIELSRAEQDLHLVEERITKNQQRLDQSSNPKDIQGIQHELVSLNKRLSDLEDAELVLMDKVDQQNAAVAENQTRRDSIQEQMTALEASQASELAKLKSGAMLLQEDRERTTRNLNEELVSHYENLALRGVAVGRFSGISCGACSMTLSGAALDEIRNTPMDELAHCNECNGILVR